MKRLMLLASALLMVSSTARTQQVDVANDTELRVAYCLGVTEQLQDQFPATGPNSVAGNSSTDPTDMELAKLDRVAAKEFANRRARLLGYLQARGLASVRSTAAISGVNAARRRGWADGVERQAVVGACVDKCSLPSNSIRACIDDCRETKGNPAVDAIRRCYDNDPLPY
jgi:hypothetical protein